MWNYNRGPADFTNKTSYVCIVTRNPIEFIGTLGNSFITHDYTYITSFIGKIGWTSIIVPHFILFTFAAILIIATLYTNTSPVKLTESWENKVPAIMLFAGAVTILSIYGVLYLTFTPVGKNIVEGVQGRYFIPAAPFILFGLAKLLPIGIRDHNKKATTYLIYIISTFILLFSGIWYFLITY